MSAGLTVLAVDDEAPALDELAYLLGEHPDIATVHTAGDATSALRELNHRRIDAVFLDINMPGLSGLELAAVLTNFAEPPAVVFVTAHDNFAVEAFDLDAVDYVLKPVTAERLERAVVRAAARRGARAAGGGDWLTEFWVPHRSELLRIAAADVDRIDAERDYVRLHVGDRSYLLLQTVSGLEARLDPDRFIRLHRSTILRRDRIAGLRHDGLGVWSAELSDGTTVRIGRTYLARAKAMAGR